MQSILYISCSPRGPLSHSLMFGEEVLDRLRQHHPGATIYRRDLAAVAPDFVDAGFSNAILDPPVWRRRSSCRKPSSTNWNGRMRW
jgi:FMN-dependent NADH-azoreductase